MGFPVTFGALAGGVGVTQPLSLFDAQFTAVGGGLIVPCAAAGQNSILLTPAANTPTIAGYTSLSPIFGFFAAQATSSSPVTISVAGIGARNVYKNQGATLIGANDFAAGGAYYVIFNPALNGGAGGWVVVNPPVAQGTGGQVQGTAKNLTCGSANAGTPNSQYLIICDAICVSDGVSNYFTALAVNVTANALVNGANGLDVGVFAATTWYYGFVIYNPTTQTIAALLSTSATAPTLPTGYTMWARVGADITDGSTHFLRSIQNGKNQQYLVGTNPALVPNIANGALGTYSTTSPVLATASITGVVPPTASKISVIAGGNYKANGGANIMLAPNTGWGGVNNGPAGSAGQVYPFASQAGSLGQLAVMVIETSTIAVASTGAGGAFSCLGYEDNL